MRTQFDDQLAHAAEDDVPLGRSRFLALVGGAMFGLTTRMLMRSSPALAWHGSPPPGCGPSGRCHCCSGTSCCQSSCTARTGECRTGGQCWSVCIDRVLYRCCDYWSRDQMGRRRRCVCRGRVGTCRRSTDDFVDIGGAEVDLLSPLDPAQELVGSDVTDPTTYGVPVPETPVIFRR